MSSHKTYVNRLKRIEGQVRGVIKMVEEDRYCIELVNQISAIESALASLRIKVFENHLNSCVKKAISDKDMEQSEKMIEEILKIVEKMK